MSTAAAGAAPAPVNTKLARRRSVHAPDMQALDAELDRLEEAGARGALTTTGNWTPGQICEHCAILMRCALDGFPSKAPWIFRTIVKLLAKKKATSGGDAPPGYKLPKQAAFLMPREDITFEEGLNELRTQVRRVLAGERFTHPSPLFDHLTHEEWTRLQLGHCRMHLSFIQIG